MLKGGECARPQAESVLNCGGGGAVLGFGVNKYKKIQPNYRLLLLVALGWTNA